MMLCEVVENVLKYEETKTITTKKKNNKKKNKKKKQANSVEIKIAVQF